MATATKTYSGREWTFYTIKYDDGHVYYVRRRLDDGKLDVSRDGQKWLRVHEGTVKFIEWINLLGE